MSDLTDALNVWAEIARASGGCKLDFVTLRDLAENAARQEAELEQAQADLSHWRPRAEGAEYRLDKIRPHVDQANFYASAVGLPVESAALAATEEAAVDALAAELAPYHEADLIAELKQAQAKVEKLRAAVEGAWGWFARECGPETHGVMPVLVEAMCDERDALCEALAATEEAP